MKPTIKSGTIVRFQQKEYIDGLYTYGKVIKVTKAGHIQLEYLDTDYYGYKLKTISLPANRLQIIKTEIRFGFEKYDLPNSKILEIPVINIGEKLIFVETLRDTYHNLFIQELYENYIDAKAALLDAIVKEINDQRAIQDSIQSKIDNLNFNFNKILMQ